VLDAELDAALVSGAVSAFLHFAIPGPGDIVSNIFTTSPSADPPCTPTSNSSLSSPVFCEASCWLNMMLSSFFMISSSHL
jgi:hypothetical protein